MIMRRQEDAKERFMECKVAYQTLVDKDQRRQYDRSRSVSNSLSISAVPVNCAASTISLPDSAYGCGNCLPNRQFIGPIFKQEKFGGI